MKATREIATYRNIRQQPLWRLLAADKAPLYIGLLQAHLMDTAKIVPASVLHERIGRDMERLRAQGEDLPQLPQAYLSEWLSQGWVTRRFPPGAHEEEYELTADGAAAIRFVASLVSPRISATESRLATVIQQLARLTEETDTNPRSRMAALLMERNRIESEIANVEQGHFKTLPDDRAIERVREIIMLAENLAGDFRRVRDDFDRLNRGLRESLMDNDGSRGDILEALFAGVDIIGESEAGLTFAAFWRLLTDQEQSETLETAVLQVTERPFSQQLKTTERRFLLRLTQSLLEEGGSVHDVLQHFAKSLKTFVQSREYLEQRRLHALLREAQRAALEIKDTVRANQLLDHSLTLTSSRIRSLSQWVLYDPHCTVTPGMADGEPALIDLHAVGELVRQSEIDFRTLKENVHKYVVEHGQASIRELMCHYPVTQGLGTVVGYIALGARHGEPNGELEIVDWKGLDGKSRRARIPIIYFLRERLDELIA